VLSRGEPRRFAYPDCARPSGLVRDVGLGTDHGRRHSYHHAVVAPEVAEVEIVYRGGRSVRGPTTDGPAYRGRYAGKVRFFLLEERAHRRGIENSYLKLYAADGGLLAVEETYFFGRVRVGPTRQLARGRTAGTGWALRSFVARRLVPLPGHEERFVEEHCVEVRPDHGGRRSAVDACVHPDNPRDHDSYSFRQRCERIGYVAVGTVGADVRGVVATLGDGRARRAVLRDLPDAHGDGRAFALVLPRDVAVRRLVAIGRGGVRELIDGAHGPGAVRCGDDGVLIFFSGYKPATPRGPLGFTVYDDGVWLCATLGIPSSRPGECGPPPIQPYESTILSRREGDRALVAAIVPGDITRVVVRLASGRRIPLPTAEGPYAGLYSGLVRFFTLELRGRQSVQSLRIFDSQGRMHAVLPVGLFDEPVPRGRPRVVVGGPPGLRLRAGWLGAVGTPREYLCVSLGGGDCGFASPLDTNVRAECRPRRLVLWGLLPRGRTAVTVETDRGDVAARVEPLPPGLRDRRRRRAPNYAAAAGYVAVLPANARPTAIEISGRKPLRNRLELPSAAAQCGYDDFLFS
jgi:hypothetical protein